ncbi:hypothetical protein ABS768_01145 [Flavobacterium sp. ST-75]|uniref:DUF1700 domain-containing protein n=1 Tax=Flavobacterium rhizophilum TaxID=3163296 RepID=A0ABW8Y7A1_9FLAO
MILSEQQIEYISDNLKFYGLTTEELHSDVLDHICSLIENSKHNDFDTAYKEAIKNFGGYNEMRAIERDTYLLITFRKNMRREKFVSAFGLISTLFICIGILFKVMHWPWASISLVIGFFFLIFGFLPLFFYQKYKLSFTRNI